MFNRPGRLSKNRGLVPNRPGGLLRAVPFKSRRSHKREFVRSSLALGRARGVARISGRPVKSGSCSIASHVLKGRRAFRRLRSGFCAAGWQRPAIYPQRQWLSKERKNFLGWFRVRQPDTPGWIDSTVDARWSVRNWLVDRSVASHDPLGRSDEGI